MHGNFCQLDSIINMSFVPSDFILPETENCKIRCQFANILKAKETAAEFDRDSRDSRDQLKDEGKHRVVIVAACKAKLMNSRVGPL